MNYVSVSYAYNYTLDFAPEYAMLKNICVNKKTGIIIKKVVNNRCIGYNIRGKFYSLSYLRNHLTKVKNEKTPF